MTTTDLAEVDAALRYIRADPAEREWRKREMLPILGAVTQRLWDYELPTLRREPGKRYTRWPRRV